MTSQQIPIFIIIKALTPLMPIISCISTKHFVKEMIDCWYLFSHVSFIFESPKYSSSHFVLLKYYLAHSISSAMLEPSVLSSNYIVNLPLYIMYSNTVFAFLKFSAMFFYASSNGISYQRKIHLHKLFFYVFWLWSILHIYIFVKCNGKM